MFKLFVLAAILFVAVSAEPEAKPQVHAVAPFAYNHAAYPHHYGAYPHLDAYKHHPYSYDATKYSHHYGAYPYAHHNAYTYNGAHAYPHTAGYTGYPHHYGVHPYHAAGYQHPYAGVYNNAHVIAKA